MCAVWSPFGRISFRDCPWSRRQVEVIGSDEGTVFRSTRSNVAADELPEVQSIDDRFDLQGPVANRARPLMDRVVNVGGCAAGLLIADLAQPLIC